jgi:hypothetical protein
LKGDRLPPEHHVARHCRKNDLVWDGTGIATGVLECALTPDAEGVSTTWLEFFGGARQHNLSEVKRCQRLMPRSSNRLAVLNVGNIENVGSGVGAHVVEDPDDPPCPPGNPAHALIKDPVSFQDKTLREAMAFMVQAGDIEPYF